MKTCNDRTAHLHTAWVWWFQHNPIQGTPAMIVEVQVGLSLQRIRIPMRPRSFQ